jgi:TIR domain
MLILISHAVEDEPAAAALKEMIRRCSLNHIDVWFSSDRSAIGGMPMGGPWFNELSNRLKTTDWVVALVTPQSLMSPWLYFECGFGACNKTHSVVPLAIGIPVSNVPMPLAAYQIYDAANAASLATFLEKMLGAGGIIYDEEMTKGVREATQRRMIEHQTKRAHEQGVPASASSQTENISALRSFIEQRFVELYDMIPLQQRPTVSLQVSFDVSEFIPSASSVVLNVPSSSSVLDVLSEIYIRLERYVEEVSYLVQRTIMDTKDKTNLSFVELAQRIPANVVFGSDRKYKVKRLSGGDEYIQNAIRILQKEPK